MIRLAAFEADLIRHYADIAVEQPAAAERFALAADDLVDSLSHHPKLGRVWHPTDARMPGVRVRKVPGFNVLVFYLTDDRKVRVLRAMHGARGDLMRVIADELTGTDDA
ncbi:type II toxin-antitoxin system RelE/ParE family toxin [Phycisphaeraceae bacterium D3-23]